MYQDSFYPFYRNFQDPLFWEEERLQERENRLMRSFYPKTALELQRKVEEECDRLDYPGSFIYDEYPDKFMMEHLCRKIEREILSEDEKEDQQQSKIETRAMERDRGDGLRDLIGVLLFNEMFRRRCRHRRCRRFF